MPQPVDVVIITALEEEQAAILSKLPNTRRQRPTRGDVHIYYACDLPFKFDTGKEGTYRVIVTSLLHPGRVAAASTTRDAIHRWNPRVIIFVGIAGGVATAGVQLGDVLVSDQIIDDEPQKITRSGPQNRWQAYQVDHSLLATARNLKPTKWKRQITVTRPTRGTPQRLVGPVVSTDAVIASNRLLTNLLKTWPKLIGVEMEGAGAASAALHSASPPGIFMIRGVSDHADEHKGSESIERWRSYACDVAAAYTVALLQSGALPVDRASGERNTDTTNRPTRSVQSTRPSSRRRSTPQNTSPLDQIIQDISTPRQPFTHLDKNNFTTETFSIIKKHFQKMKRTTKRQRRDVEIEITDITTQRFTVTFYINGNYKHRCSIWLGESQTEKSIFFSDRINISGMSESWSDNLVVAEYNNDLYMRSNFSFISAFNSQQGQYLNQQQVAEYLWEKFSTIAFR